MYREPEKKGNTVEFIPNCIMVIDEKGKFISLWPKPLVCTSWQKVFEQIISIFALLKVAS